MRSIIAACLVIAGPTLLAGAGRRRPDHDQPQRGCRPSRRPVRTG